MIRADEPDNGIMIELTPIIDMLFLLLIFFLVATTFHQTEREAKVILPYSSTAGPISTALREIVVNVDAEGAIVVGGRHMAEQDLSSLITEAVAANPEQKVTVRGDHATAYGNVYHVLDICKAGGIQDPYLASSIEAAATP